MSMWLYISKGYGCKLYLQMILETLKKPLIIKIKCLEQFLADLSKAFVSLSDNLLIAKFHENALVLLSCA